MHIIKLNVIVGKTVYFGLFTFLAVLETEKSSIRIPAIPQNIFNLDDKS